MKNNNYHFGGKVYIGVDVDSGLVQSATIIKASVLGKTERDNLLHGKEKNAMNVKWGFLVKILKIFTVFT